MDRIEHMRAFAAVVAAGSFTAAAARLGATPQLISKHVKALEEDLQVRLLNRTTRKIHLTETGRAFHGRCVRLLEDYDELRAVARDDHGSAQGVLTVTAPTTFGEMYLIDAVADFLDAYPAVETHLTLSDRFVSLIDEGFDVAVRLGALADSTLVARKLAAAQILVCAAPAYLESAPPLERPRDLVRHDCIVDLNVRFGPDWPFVVDGARETVRVKGRLRVNSARAARQMALRGAGVALCPSFMVGEDLARGDLVSLFETRAATEIGVYAVYMENRYASAKIRAFVAFMAARFKDAPWAR